MPKSDQPRHDRPLTRRLHQERCWRAFKEFFDHFNYNTFNARCRAEQRPEDEIHYRRANLRGTATAVFRLVIAGVKKRQRPGEAIRFNLQTCRGSLATLLDRSMKTVDRHLHALRQMQFLQDRRRTGRGLELVAAASLFIFLDSGEPRHVPPVPAAHVVVATSAEEEVPLDPAMQLAIEKEERRQAMLAKVRKKNGENGPPGPFHPMSGQTDTY